MAEYRKPDPRNIPGPADISKVVYSTGLGPAGRGVMRPAVRDEVGTTVGKPITGTPTVTIVSPADIGKPAVGTTSVAGAEEVNIVAKRPLNIRSRHLASREVEDARLTAEAASRKAESVARIRARQEGSIV